MLTFSLEAIFLSIFVLIAQNRSARVDELRSEIDLHLNTIAEEELTKLLQIVTLLADKLGVDISADPRVRERSPRRTWPGSKACSPIRSSPAERRAQLPPGVADKQERPRLAISRRRARPRRRGARAAR